MSIFHSIQDFFHPSGASDRAQLREGERLLTAAGYHWAYGTDDYNDLCEFCDRKMPTIFTRITKTNPLGQKFQCYGEQWLACPYCRYVERPCGQDKNRVTFDKMSSIYPPRAIDP
jgi:hypothetical protein